MGQWQTHGSRVVYENPWITVREDAVTNPAGNKVVYGYYEIGGGGFTYIVPLDKERNTYLTRQFRYPLGEESWEYASGQTDHEDHLEAARRELVEETGLEANRVIKIGDLYSDSGISSGRGTVHLATGIRKITDTLDPVDGILEVRKLPFEEIGNMIVRGEIKCPHTISSFYMASRYLEAHPEVL